MSQDKYPSIFSPQMETVLFVILQIFFSTHAVLKIGEYLALINRAGGLYGRLLVSSEGQ